MLLVLILISLDYCVCSASGCGVKLKNRQFELIFHDVYDCLPSPTAASRCGLMGVRLMENIKAAVEQLSSSISVLAHSDFHESLDSSVDTDSSISVSDDDGHDGFVPSSAATENVQRRQNVVVNPVMTVMISLICFVLSS